MSRRHCVGAGAPVNFGRRRRAAGAKIIGRPKMSFYLQKFLVILKKCNKITKHAHQHGIGSDPTNYRRRRPQIDGGGGAGLYIKVGLVNSVVCITSQIRQQCSWNNMKTLTDR